ncbi:hypothetical protein TNCV_4920821 [Trichonephila clavipes]|nr:hypothetical protein TNCV_4920821 [Trichonephila clavipes]
MHIKVGCTISRFLRKHESTIRLSLGSPKSNDDYGPTASHEDCCRSISDIYDGALIPSVLLFPTVSKRSLHTVVRAAWSSSSRCCKLCS